MVARRLGLPAQAPVSLNFTGIVLPSLNTDVPSLLTGCKTPDQEKLDPVHTPSWHVSVCVHALPSSHGALLLVWTHAQSVQASSVQGLPSSHSVAVVHSANVTPMERA